MVDVPLGKTAKPTSTCPARDWWTPIESNASGIIATNHGSFA